MRKQIITGGAALMLMTASVWAASEMDAYQSTTPGLDTGDLFRGNELSLDLFGTDALNEHTITHPSGDRVRHDSRLGLGVGLNYFFTPYLGIGGEAHSEDTRHTFVDNASGSLIFRFPIGQTGLAPYAFGGGGHQFDPVEASFGHAGAGLEFRFTRNIGIFVDGRWVWTDRDRDYGLGRAGFRFAF